MYAKRNDRHTKNFFAESLCTNAYVNFRTANENAVSCMQLCSHTSRDYYRKKLLTMLQTGNKMDDRWVSSGCPSMRSLK